MNCNRCQHSGVLIRKNGRQVVWYGTRIFPETFRDARKRVNAHRRKISSFSCPCKMGFHQRRISEITTIFPTLA